MPTLSLGRGEDILLPTKPTNGVDYEAELAVVIGKRAADLAGEEALAYVAGYTIFNDVSARDLQTRDGQWMKGKCLDTFAPLGPWLVTADEIPNPDNPDIKLRLNGKLMQSSNTGEMVFGVANIVSFLSKLMTPDPGDIIVTDTPAGVGFARRPPVYLRLKDMVEIEMDWVYLKMVWQKSEWEDRPKKLG